MNVDAKISAAILAYRLQDVVTTLVRVDQIEFTKGRQSSDKPGLDTDLIVLNRKSHIKLSFSHLMLEKLLTNYTGNLSLSH